MKRLFFAAFALLFACATDDAAAPPPRPASVVFDDLTADVHWRLPGLHARVEVARDQYGIPHFYAADLHDLALVQGYVVARDRFWEMDVFRRLGEGKLSTLVGAIPVLLDVDELFRQISLTDTGTMVYDDIVASLDPQTKAMLEAYTEGVNLYLEHAATGAYGAKLPPEYNELVLGMLFQPTALDIPRWEPRDTLATGRLLQWMLSGADIESELMLGRMYAAMPVTLTSALARFRPAVTTATFDDWPGVKPGVAAAPFKPLTLAPGGFEEHMRKLREALPALLFTDAGSNNWVVGPEKSASGHVIVANDPHLIMTNPPLFYQAQFNLKEMGGSEGWNAYGVVFPGIPVFMIGHTEHIAWGVTVLGYDVLDVYRETPVDNGTAVMRGGKKIPVAYSEQKFCHGYSDDCVTRMLPYVPGHGPRVQHEDEFFTFRWTGREPTSDFFAFIRLMTAESVEQAIDAITDFRVGAMNFVIGDTAGNFAYFGPANVPKRDPACPQRPYVPLDGASGLCEWQGYLDVMDLPLRKNPAQGYLATANNDIVGTSFDNDPANDAQYLWTARDMGFRMARLKERLEAKAKFTPADMESIQADVFSYEGKLIAPYLVAAIDASPGASAAVKQAADYLRKWTYQTTTGVEDPFTGKAPTAEQINDSVATSIYYTFRRLVKPRFVGDELAAYDIEVPEESDGYDVVGVARIMLHAFEAPADAGFLWDDVSTPGTETREAIVTAAMQETVDWLTERFDSADQQTWNWGKLHMLRFFDPYGFLGANVRAIGPYPNDGALGTLDAATPLFLFGNYVQLGGPVMRMVTELDPKGVKSWNALPGGQVHDRTSKHYDDLVPGFMQNEAYPVPFAKADVRANLESLTIVDPR